MTEPLKTKMPADGAVVDAPGEGEPWRAIHVLVIPYPARGHNLASIQLARKLVPSGVRITMLNIFSDMSQDLLDICRKDNIAVENLGVRPANPGPSNLPYLSDVEILEDETVQLVEKEPQSFTCILSDIFLGWTQNVADKFGIPRYVICTSMAKVLATLLYMPELAAQGIVPVEASKASKLVHIPGVVPTRRADLSPAVQSWSGLQYFSQYVYRCCQPAMEAAAGYFVNSFYELEPSCIDTLRSYPYQRTHSKVTIETLSSDFLPGSCPLKLITAECCFWETSVRATKPSLDVPICRGLTVRNVFPVGPLVHDAYLQLLHCGSITEGRSSFMEPEASYLRWLDRQPTGSVLYVNFGSVAALSIQQIHELALGLEASNLPFLLVVRPAEKSSGLENTHENVQVLLPESFKAHAQEIGFVQSEWVNQLDVLSHPAIGGFLSHCGWGSSMESICRGVPLLAWPIQADQKLNCRYLVDEARTALEVHKGANLFVSREEVVRAARQLMVEPEGKIVRENVGKLRDKVKEGISTDGSVQRSVETFLAELKSYTCNTRLQDAHTSAPGTSHGERPRASSLS